MVLDFTAVGGPKYAQHFAKDVRYSDSQYAAANHAVHTFDAYLFGTSVSVNVGSSFQGVHGGVIQFRPRGSIPVWLDLFEDRLRSASAWQYPPASLSSRIRPWLLLGDTTLAHRTRVADAPDLPVAEAAQFVGRHAADITCCKPNSGLLQNASQHGADCGDVLAVQNAPPASSQAHAGFFCS